MDKINYLKHCTQDLENILKNGYIISGKKAEKEKNYGNYSKIFLQIEICKYEYKSIDYSNYCIMIDKKILLHRNDYVINNKGYKGIVHKNSLQKPKKINNIFINSINPIHNEVIFTDKISLKKYMTGITYSVYFDNKKDIRLDIIYKYNNYKTYFIYMKKIYNLNNKIELKKRYNKGKNILRLIEKYTNNIYFIYKSFPYLDNKIL